MEAQAQEAQETQAVDSSPAQTPTFSVPQEYADREWTSNIKSQDDLWKQFANSQELIGRRPAGIPTADAAPEEWDKFYAAAGRPDDPSGYELSAVDGLPEGADIAPFADMAAPILHAAGLSKSQAAEVWKGYLELETKAALERSAAMDAQFDELSSKYFGDNFESVSASAQKFLVDVLDEGLRTEAANATPAQQIAMITVADNAMKRIAEIEKKYGAEGSITPGEQTAPNSIEDVRLELAKLRTSEAVRDFTHPDHKKSIARIEQLSEVVRRSVK